MPLGVGLLTLAALSLWIYCILDVISTPEGMHRNLPKLGWLVIVVLLPTVGSLVWLIGGRPRNAVRRPGGGPGRPAQRPRGPDDDPDFLRGL